MQPSLATAAAAAVCILVVGGMWKAGKSPTHHQQQRTREAREDTDSFLLDWFLTDAEIQTAMGDQPRAHLPTYTTGNDVVMLLDGSEVLEAMYKEISFADIDDTLLGSFWSFGGECVPV
jgi:hypothetical protein